MYDMELKWRQETDHVEPDARRASDGKELGGQTSISDCQIDSTNNAAEKKTLGGPVLDGISP